LVGRPFAPTPTLLCAVVVVQSLVRLVILLGTYQSSKLEEIVVLVRRMLTQDLL